MNLTRGAALIVGMLICGLAAADEQAAGAMAPVQGVWEGPWYRGMTSGKVKVQVKDDGGTIQFTNLDIFGGDAHPITHVKRDGQSLSFRADGEKGGPLTATLKLNEAGTQMRGLGKFDGFPLRFELRRSEGQ